MLAMIAMTTGMSAQDNSGQRHPRMNREEMVQQRTDFMAQQYGLNDVQKQQLLELNKKYADSIPMMKVYHKPPFLSFFSILQARQ